MGMSTIIQMRNKGSLTLPAEFRRKYGLSEGDVFTLIDLGDGNILLTPRLLEVERFGDRVAEALEEDGVSLEDLLQALDDERQRYYLERYAGE